VPAIVVFVLLAKLLPMFLFGPLLGLLLPLSAAAGGAYALVHNQTGGRETMPQGGARAGQSADRQRDEADHADDGGARHGESQPARNTRHWSQSTSQSGRASVGVSMSINPAPV
jgi:hypothetical protein